MFSRKSSPDLCFQGIYQLTYALKLYINWPMLSSCSADSFLFWIHSSGIDMVYLNKIFIRNVQGGQNFLKKSEQNSVHFQNKSVKSVHFFCKKSDQFFQFFKKNPYKPYIEEKCNHFWKKHTSKLNCSCVKGLNFFSWRSHYLAFWSICKKVP